MATPVEPFKLRHAPIRSTCECWNFRFDPMGWAIVQLDRESGTFSITSDYGNWSYTWNPKDVGELHCVKNFIANVADTHYLTGKLTQGARDEFDPEATEKALFKLLQDEEQLGEDAMTEEKARELIEECGFDSGHDLFLERAPKVLYELFPDTWQLLEMRTPHMVVALRDGLLPIIKQQLSKELAFESRLALGTSVKTLEDEGGDWVEGARVDCVWGARGKVCGVTTGHGVFYVVKHYGSDTKAPYDPKELKVMPGPSDEDCPVDCGDNSCICSSVPRGRRGMRTNGGCRCFRNGTPKEISRKAHQAVMYWRRRAEKP